jgi:hypothetical protein
MGSPRDKPAIPRSRFRRERTGLSALTRLRMRMSLFMDDNPSLFVSPQRKNRANGYRL